MKKFIFIIAILCGLAIGCASKSLKLDFFAQDKVVLKSPGFLKNLDCEGVVTGFNGETGQYQVNFTCTHTDDGWTSYTYFQGWFLPEELIKVDKE
jgi:hypothetical protein